MSDKPQTKKSKNADLLKEIRVQKSLPALEKIYEDLKQNKSYLYDNNVIPYQFSNDLLWFLQNNFIKTDTQLDIYKLYIDEFFDMKLKPEDMTKVKFLFEIYNYETNFYRNATYIDNFLIFLNKFFNIYYPKNNSIEHEVGDVMDYLVSEERFQTQLFGWIQIPIKRIDKEKKLYIFEDINSNKEVMVAFDSFKVQEKNTFVKEEEMNWRNNLKEGDKVDYLTSNKNWVEGTIKEINSNGEISVKAYSEIEQNIGFFKKYSPFIQPLLKYSFKYEPEEINCLNLLERNCEFQRFNYMVPWTEKNYGIPFDDLKFYSLEYYEMINYFFNKLISTKILEKEDLPLQYIYIILNIIFAVNRISNRRFIGKYFYEKCFENIKKILLDYSLNKKNIISKFFIENIISYIYAFLGFHFYLYQLNSIYITFVITFGYNCFKISETLEKRLVGLNLIAKFLAILNNYYPILKSESVGEISALISDKLLNNSENKDLFGLLFNDPNIHEQLLIKGVEIIILLAKINLLDDKDIDRLYNLALSSPEDSDSYVLIYNLLNQISNQLTLKQQKVIFDKILSFPYEKLNKNDIDLMKNILKNIKSKEEFKTMTKKFLDYYYTYIVDFKHKDTKYLPDFGKIMSYSPDEENLNYLYLHYFEKVINDINNQNDIDGFSYYLKLIHSIFNSLDSYTYQHRYDDNENDSNKEDSNRKAIRDAKMIFKKLSEYMIKKKANQENSDILKFDTKIIKTKFKEIFLRYYKDYGVIVDKLLLLNSKEKETNEQNIKDVIDIVRGLINFIQEKKFYTIEGIMKMADYFVFTEEERKYRHHYIYDLLNIDNELGFDYNALYECFFKKFNDYFNLTTPEKQEKNKLLDSYCVGAIFSLYKDINTNPKLKSNYQRTPQENYNNQILKLTQKINPLNNKFFDIVWKMYIKINENRTLKEYLEDFSLKNFSTSERHEIWEKLVKKIFTDIDSNILVGLKMIEYILKFSEVYGNGGAFAHQITTKKRTPLNLHFISSISSSIKAFNNEKNDKISCLDTVYSLKKFYQKLYGIDPIFIDFTVPIKNNNLSELNSTPMFKLFPKLIEFPNEICNLKVKTNTFFHHIYPHPLMNEDNSSLTDEYFKVVVEIFDKYAKDEKLDINNFKLFYNHWMNLIDSDTSLENEAISTFHKFDMQKKGYWGIDDFIIFHANLAEEKKDKLYMNLEHLGYTKTLEYYFSDIPKNSPLYYEENNIKEYMPRYFIGNNKEYMSKLFQFAKSDNKLIHEPAQNIIKELCTFEEIKKTIFENSQKIDEIVSNNNLELRAYAYDILLSEFEKNDIQKNEVTENLLNNFINNNLYKLIVELDKFNKKEDKNVDSIQNEENPEQKKIENSTQTSQFMNYYLSNLKILYYAFKNITKNEKLMNYIDKFEELDDQNEKNKIKKIKIELDEEKQNLIQKLDFQKLVNIIGSNIILFEKNSSTTQKQGIRLSLKILIYIILLSFNLPKEQKEKIYKDFFNYQIKYIKDSLYLIKRNFFIMNKIILPFMNEESDQTYINLENEQIIKAIKDYKNLNALSGKLMFFFRLCSDLYELAIKDTQNDKIYEFLEDLLKLILDKNFILELYTLTGYLGIVKKLLNTLKESKYPKIYEYNFESLISTFINDFIITSEKDENNKIIELKKLKKYSKFSEFDYVSNIYQILYIIISINPKKYIKLFFENEEIKNVIGKHLTKLDDEKIGYSPKGESINYGFVGLKNLSCLCYINSVIQQFFMIPLFQNAILSLPLDPNLKEEADNDNLIFQLEKMFYYLQNSEKEHYNPKHFVFSFKDYDGNPTNINVQCDAQEFLSRLIEKIDEGLKNGPERYLCSNIFGGSTLQQVKCTNPDCGNISERKENINYLSLDIKDCSKLKECLEKFIKEEKIEDYHCEKCDKKITNIKNVLIDKIPNILIIHLQRIAFSYENFTMEKINRNINFEKTLNIKNYTLNKDNKDIPDEYYEYELQGVLIHSGTAQFGHYYSIINSDKYDKNGKWYKFNDTSITESSFDQVENEGFGAFGDQDYGSSAYMLIYQKVTKKPVIINNKEINDNIKKILEKNENLEKIDGPEGKIYYIYKNEKEAVENNLDLNKYKKENINIDKNIILKNSLTEAELVSYEQALDILQKKNNDPNTIKPFINTIYLENINLCNDKKFFTKGFTKFMEQISELLKKEIIEDATNNQINEYIEILKIINCFILQILAKSNYTEELYQIVNHITDIYSHSVPKDLLTYLIKDIIEQRKVKLYENYFVSKDRTMGDSIAEYIGKILCCGLNNNIETELVMKIIQFYIDKIPVEISKKWLDMGSFNYLIMILIENSDIIKKTFINNGMITKLIDFILGRNSPIYQGDERTENKYNKGKFGPIVKSVALLFKYYVENYKKEEIKLSASDLKLINHKPFYEKVVLDDYDSAASNLLIDNKMKLSFILNKEEKDKNEDNDKEILDIIVDLKIPSILKKEEILSGLELIINLFKQYNELYLNKENNQDKFIERLNILLGIPVPFVENGNAEIRYMSNKNERTTILVNISKQKEINREIIPLLLAIFNLLDVNHMIFTYMDNLPAPNSLKYSYLDYILKIFLLTEKQMEEESKAIDEIGAKNPIKELSIFVNDICKKYNKNLEEFKENNKIDINNSLYFNEFSFDIIKDINVQNVSVYEMTVDYTSMKNPKKIDLACFSKGNYFCNLISRKGNNNSLVEDGLEKHTLLCIVICCLSELELSIQFKPYFYSKIEIKGKKEKHYFIYCMDYDNNDKKIDYSKLIVETKDSQPLALLPANGEDQMGGTNDCVINCPMCGSVNILNMSNTEFKCNFCESPLF